MRRLYDLVVYVLDDDYAFDWFMALALLAWIVTLIVLGWVTG